MYGLTFDPIVPIQIILLLNFNGPTRGIFTFNRILSANILVKSEGMDVRMEDAAVEEMGNICGFRDNDILKLDNQHCCCSALPLLLS